MVFDFYEVMFVQFYKSKTRKGRLDNKLTRNFREAHIILFSDGTYQELIPKTIVHMIDKNSEARVLGIVINGELYTEYLGRIIDHYFEDKTQKKVKTEIRRYERMLDNWEKGIKPDTSS